MAKLVLLALAFTAMVALAQVSAYKTVITTTTIEDAADDFVSNPRGGSSQQCGSEIQMQQLSHCQMHLAQGSRSPYLRMRVQEGQQHLQQCCQQLEKVRGQCQCEAIQMVFDETRVQMGGGAQQMMGQMARKAEQLPKQCNLDVQECPIRTPRV